MHLIENAFIYIECVLVLIHNLYNKAMQYISLQYK